MSNCATRCNENIKNRFVKVLKFCTVILVLMTIGGFIIPAASLLSVMDYYLLLLAGVMITSFVALRLINIDRVRSISIIATTVLVFCLYSFEYIRYYAVIWWN